MHTQNSAAPPRRSIDRRSVIRAGAWTVPVVSLAVAAPALAASATKGTLKFDTFNVFGADYNNKGKPTTVQSQVQVQNVFTTGGPTLSSVTVLVTYPGSRVDGAVPSPSRAPAGRSARPPRAAVTGSTASSGSTRWPPRTPRRR